MAVAAAIAAAAAGHWVYWYASRERSSTATESPAASLLDRTDLGLALWIPYPHQNLAHLDERVGGLDRYAADLAALLERRPAALPSFGPFAVPPATAIGLAVEAGGSPSLVVAEIYPLIRRVAKASGRLTGNRWLAGGEVERGGEAYEVTWRGAMWQVARKDRSLARGSPASERERERSLGRARLNDRLGVLPAGSYRLVREGADLKLASVPPPARSFWSPSSVAAPFLMLSGVGAGDEPPGGLILRSAAAEGGGLRLPGMAVFGRSADTTWRLPGGRLGELVGGRLERGRIGGWAFAATDGATARWIAAEAGPLSDLLDRAKAERLELGLSLDVGEVRHLAEGLADGLEEVPLVGRRAARTWRIVERLLTPLPPDRRLTASLFASAASRATVEVRLSAGRAVE